jgi:leucyl-tRNA synthetase
MRAAPYFTALAGIEPSIARTGIINASVLLCVSELIVAGKTVRDVYDFAVIERKWQAEWQKRNAFRAFDFVSGKEPYYMLEMFPYPSGYMHMGHMRNYTLGDVMARLAWKQGRNVLHPIGFDSFGLPAEQAAIDRGVDPREWNEKCISNIVRQMKMMGFSYDWERSVVTSRPDYYKWTQWLFIKLYEMGLVYRKENPVNWCEEHGVLANDEAQEGKCWRCERVVTQKKLEQWYIKTTAYADELLAGLDELKAWPERVVTMQRNWIGKSRGTRVSFDLPAIGERIEVFTTRIDTLYGVTFLVLAPEHPFVARIAENVSAEKRAEIARFVEEVSKVDVIERTAEGREKHGLPLGISCVHPLTGDEVTLFIADYVLMDYGTGAVMAVPAHDSRDYAFAQKYGLPIKWVIRPTEGEWTEDAAFTEYGIMANSGKYDGLTSKDGIDALSRDLETDGLGGFETQYRLKDWTASRQRYWGCPIPMIKCASCGYVPVRAENLPVLLPPPDVVDMEKRDKGSPLEYVADFVECACPNCGGAARRETDTMTTFMDSAWYFLRYCDPENDAAIFVGDKVNHWMPVDLYIGGIEHAVGHVLYARFITRVLRNAGLLDFAEPFDILFTQGMIYKDGAKMSKSLGNTVSPDDMVEDYGADTARLFSLFAGPPERDLEWQDEGVQGCNRFLRRVWRIFAEFVNAYAAIGARASTADVASASIADAPRDAADDTVAEIRRMEHVTIKGVTDDIAKMQFNTAIAKMMEFVNFLQPILVNEIAPAADKLDAGEATKAGVASPNAGDTKLAAAVEMLDAGGIHPIADAFKNAMTTLASLMSPFTPHIAEEMWEILGCDGLAMHAPWPAFDESLIATATVEIGVVVNGKLRARVRVPADADADAARAAVLADPSVQKWTEGKEVVKFIYDAGRSVTVIVR